MWWYRTTLLACSACISSEKVPPMLMEYMKLMHLVLSIYVCGGWTKNRCMEVKLSLHGLNSYSLVATELGMLLRRVSLTITGIIYISNSPLGPDLRLFDQCLTDLVIISQLPNSPSPSPLFLIFSLFPGLSISKTNLTHLHYFT